MRRLAMTLLLAACRSSSPTPPTPTSQPGVTIAYDIDPEPALEDKAADVARDFEAQLAEESIRAKFVVRPNGVIAVTPSDRDRDRIARLMRDTVGNELELRDCSADLPLGSVCVALTEQYRQAIKKAVLESAVEVVRKRIAAQAPKVSAKDDQIVVELPSLPESELTTVKAKITTTNRLEFVVVDDDSEFMRRIYRHVGVERDGSAVDPTARALGITADMDVWRDEGSGQKRIDHYLNARDLRGQPAERILERYLGDLAAHDPSFVLSSDRAIRFERVIPPAGTKDTRPYVRSYYVHRGASLTGTAITSAKVEEDASAKRPIVVVEFNRYGSRVFGDLTSTIAGKKLATLLDGKVMSAPVVNEPIRGGKVSIWLPGDVSARQAEELVKVLRSGALPSPLREAAPRKP